MKNTKRTECVIYDRVVGWYSAKNSMNKGKIAEKDQLKRYKVKYDEL
jgi:hypothetical protein